MTGSLSLFTALKNIDAINFYMEGRVLPTTKKLIKIAINNLTKFERRALMYPYLVRDNEEPFVVGYFDVLSVVKIFVPKLCNRIRVVDINGDELDVEGLFFDTSDSDTMLEYNIDKVVTLLNKSTTSDIESYFIDLHQNYLLDTHREDIEIIPSHVQERSLVSIYLTKLSNRPRTAEGIGGLMWSNDESLWGMGTKINEKDNEISIYPTGVKAHSSLVKDDFSIDFVGDSISGDNRTYLYKEADENYYRLWANDDDKLNDPTRHIIYERFKWRVDDEEKKFLDGRFLYWFVNVNNGFLEKVTLYLDSATKTIRMEVYHINFSFYNWYEEFTWSNLYVIPLYNTPLYANGVYDENNKVINIYWIPSIKRWGFEHKGERRVFALSEEEAKKYHGVYK